MSVPNKNAPAFPVATVFNPNNGEPTNTGHYWEGNGMTLRDYAAIKFTAAIIANPASYDKDGNWLHEHQTAAELGLALADDFLAEREKGAQQ